MKIIITEKQLISLKLKRRFSILPIYVRSTYKWLNPRAFENFDDFVDRVIFSATRDFVADKMGAGDDYELQILEVTPFVTEIVNGILHSEILDYFNEEN